jgi:hypothetical protein
MNKRTMQPYRRIDPARTWKANYQELAKSCDKAREYCAFLTQLLYDSETSGLTFVCRTHGEYASQFGSMWYLARNGAVVEIDHDQQTARTFVDLADAISLYATFRVPHNVATYQELLKHAAA